MFLKLLWVYIHTGQAEMLGCRGDPPKACGFYSHRGQANFSDFQVWIYIQSNIKNIIFAWVHNIKTRTKNSIIIKNICIEGTRLCSEMPNTRINLAS
jgi:hypothetical protein